MEQLTCKGCKYYINATYNKNRDVFDPMVSGPHRVETYTIQNEECRRYPPGPEGFPFPRGRCGEYAEEIL